MRRAFWVPLVAAATAHAAAPRSGPRLAADTLTALPAANLPKPLRIATRVRWGESSPAWTRFVTRAGGSWQAAWDAATGVPMQIFGTGIPAPGSVGDPAIAERMARQVLADHLALLAPGASPADFELVSNVLDGDLRAVGFVQRSNGRRVVGGQVSFRFKRDRLFVIGSQALPHVAIAIPRVRASTSRGIAALRNAAQLQVAPIKALGDDVVLPLIADDGVLGYRLASPLEIDGGADGRYLGYIDPATGDVLAVQQQNEYATGTVLYHGVDRYPGRGYVDRPAPRAYVTVNGQAQTTTPAGGVAWSPDVDVPLATSITGDLVNIVNKALVCSNDGTMICVKDADCGANNHCIAGPVAAATLAIAPSSSVVWDATAATWKQADGTIDHEDDAQLDAYLDVNIVKEFVRNNIDPSMPTLDEQMTINVNIAQECNAFFDGKALNFFHASKMCENTARIQDVGWHEFGHRLHTAEIIAGVGNFDGAMSEGVADFLAASITGESGMGRGFFYTDTPLRDLDPPPPAPPWKWPDDIGEIHHQGQIIGGTFWDLRKTFVAQYGDAAGVALTEKLYLGALRRAINIPSCLIAVLETDDDDGDLSNGTPHECQIRAAFGRHGLRTATGTVEAPGTIDQLTNAIVIGIDVTGLSTRCPGEAVTSAKLAWRPGYAGVPVAGSVDAQLAGPNRFYAQLPLAPQDSVFYKATVAFSDGSTLELADNLADPYYQLYTGHTVQLYCTDFETDPFAEGWTTGTADGTPSTWSWGTPTAGATNPHAAYSGTHILSEALDSTYLAKQYAWVKTPEIDVRPYSDVRVQYRRWLAVEDSHFDQARVTANDTTPPAAVGCDGGCAWLNYTQGMGDSSSIHHIDKEWRFHDVPLSTRFTGHKLQVGWDLKSDAGLQFAGWNLDDVCVVANPNSICGDGIKQPSEQCDSGAANADLPGQCRTDCRLPTCGDNIVDTGEECDVGPMGDTRCSAKCKLIDPGVGGCCSASGGAGGPLLALLVGALLLRRRR